MPLTQIHSSLVFASFYFHFTYTLKNKHDADGNRVLTIYKSGPTETSRVYTPFPEFEESVPVSGATTQRRSYYLAGQFIAVRVRTGTSGNGTLYFAYADHLGSIAGYYDVTLAKFLDVSLARYEPSGGYRTKPLATVNPGSSGRKCAGQ
jgi:hypothetical protein